MKSVLAAHVILVCSLLLWKEPSRPPAMKVRTHTILATTQRETKPSSISTKVQPGTPSTREPPAKAGSETKKPIPSQQTTHAPHNISTTKPISPSPKKSKPVAVPQKAGNPTTGSSSDVASQRSKQAAQAAALAKQASQTIQSAAPAPSSVTPIASSIGILQSEQWAYEDILSSFLMQALILPEPFDVVVSITVQRNGRIATCKVVESVSAMNQQYVTNLLPTLRVPPLESPWNQGASHTFSIRLQPQQKG